MSAEKHPETPGEPRGEIFTTCNFLYFTYVQNCKATVALLPKTTTPTLVESAPIISRSTRLAANSSIWTENINYLLHYQGCPWSLQHISNFNFNYLVELWFTFAQFWVCTLPDESRINTRSIAVAQYVVPWGPTGLQSGHSETFHVWLILVCISAKEPPMNFEWTPPKPPYVNIISMKWSLSEYAKWNFSFSWLNVFTMLVKKVPLGPRVCSYESPLKTYHCLFPRVCSQLCSLCWLKGPTWT